MGTYVENFERVLVMEVRCRSVVVVYETPARSSYSSFSAIRQIDSILLVRNSTLRRQPSVSRWSPSISNWDGDGDQSISSFTNITSGNLSTTYLDSTLRGVSAWVLRESPV